MDPNLEKMIDHNKKLIVVGDTGRVIADVKDYLSYIHGWNLKAKDEEFERFEKKINSMIVQKKKKSRSSTKRKN